MRGSATRPAFCYVISKIETLRFKDENDYEYEILFKVFSRIIKK